MTTSSSLKATVKSINEYARKHHNSKLICTMLPEKGRVLLLSDQCHIGDIIIVEPPLHVVQADPNSDSYKQLEKICRKNNFHLEPIWYWCALNSLVTEDAPVPPKLASMGLMKITKLTQDRLLTLFIPDVDGPCSEVEILLDKFQLVEEVDSTLLERLLQVWIQNCFEHSDDPLGYVIYYMPSFSSHSCFPNVNWVVNAQGEFVLRARRDIRRNEESMLAYLPEEGLFEPTHMRRAKLDSAKDFICQCSRCVAAVDLSRGFVCPQCKVGIVFLGGEKEPNYKAIENPTRKKRRVTPSQHLNWDTVGSFTLTSYDKSHLSPLTNPKTKGILLNKATERAALVVSMCSTVCTSRSASEFLSNYEPIVCIDCGHALNGAEIQELVHKETDLIKRAKSVIGFHKQATGKDTDSCEVHGGDVLSDAEESSKTNGCSSEHKIAAEAWETRMSLFREMVDTFSQHWALIRFLPLQSLWHATRQEWAPSIWLQARALHSVYRMYPCATGHLGWVMEELGDRLVAAWKEQQDSPAEGFNLEDTREAALTTYAQSLNLIVSMFGVESEFATDIRNKVEKLNHLIKAT